jgi:hypothetical protein
MKICFADSIFLRYNVGYCVCAKGCARTVMKMV